jgi:phospholipid transport system substrate-binding protein
MLRNGYVLAFSLVLSLFAGSVRAAEDPATARATSFCTGLVETVRHSKGLTTQARINKLLPLVQESFNTLVMAQFATGAAWAAMTPAERSSVGIAFTRYSAGRLAQEFDSYNGETCVIDTDVQTRGADKLVKSKILQPGEDAVSLNYRLRVYGQTTKIVDIYYNGVSQLATERSDFAGVLRSGGAVGLTARLNELTARLR